MFFFFNDTATTEIYTLSLHDALPISRFNPWYFERTREFAEECERKGLVYYHSLYNTHNLLETAAHWVDFPDRKSTRLNSSHANISYAVFCLKKKKKLHTGNNLVCVFH